MNGGAAPLLAVEGVTAGYGDTSNSTVASP